MGSVIGRVYVVTVAESGESKGNAWGLVSGLADFKKRARILPATYLEIVV